jgi:hypothetical protein
MPQGYEEAEDPNDRPYSLFMRGWLKVHPQTGRIEFDEVSLEQQIVMRLKDKGLINDANNNEVIVEVKKPYMAPEVFEVVCSVIEQNTVPYLGSVAEQLESQVSPLALARLFLLRNALHNEPKSPEEAIGSTNMLLTLDALGVIDAQRWNELLDPFNGESSNLKKEEGEEWRG